MSIRHKIFLILAIIWMGVIYGYSAQPGDESGETSIWAGTMFARIFVPGFDDWSETEQIEFAEKIDHLVRKAAHFTEYAILGFLVAGTYATKDKSKKKNILIPWLLATIYAATDELHQVFVPGRDGNIKDVLLDSAGCIFGVTMMLLILNISFSSRKQERPETIDAK